MLWPAFGTVVNFAFLMLRAMILVVAASGGVVRSPSNIKVGQLMNRRSRIVMGLFFWAM